MDPVVSTLLGVLLGGGIASGTNFYLEHLRAHREENAAKQRDRKDARRAARLLAEQLQHGRAIIERARERSVYTWEPPKRPIPASAWTEYRADFALVASDEAWATVATAFGEFDRLNWHVIDELEEDHYIGRPDRHPYHEPLEVSPKAELADAIEKADAALAILRGLMAGGD